MLSLSAAHPFLIEGSDVFEHLGGHSGHRNLRFARGGNTLSEIQGVCAGGLANSCGGKIFHLHSLPERPPALFGRRGACIGPPPSLTYAACYVL